MKYHSHQDLISDLQQVHQLAGPELSELFSIGESVRNASLTGIRLGRQPGEDKDDLRPLVKMVSSLEVTTFKDMILKIEFSGCKHAWK